MRYQVGWECVVEANTIVEAIRLAIDNSKNPTAEFIVNGKKHRVTTPLALIRFTPKEEAAMALVAEGRSNKEVGAVMGIEERTVKAHVAKLMRKTGCRNRIELATKIVTQHLQEELDELKSQQSSD